MFRKNYTVKIDLPGGIVAAGQLYAIVEAAEKAKVSNMQLGTRQQLYCKVIDKYGEAFLEDLRQAGLSYEVNEERSPNIVSSYVTQGIFEGEGGASWLSEGLYKDILDSFDFRPRLKVNLVERSQSFVPFFTGNINFISSPIGNYWYLYVRLPQTTQVFLWKELICSQDIPRICRWIEEASPALSFESLYTIVRSKGQLATQPITGPLSLPPFDLPYYEGFNRYGSKTWLGIYRREELFPLSFLKDICLVCLQTRVGQLYTTPWKSLIIKGIEERHRTLWEFVLGKYRINVRHASNELNWQVEDLSEEGLRLKRYLVRQFDLEDVRTDGLCFAIKTRPRSGLSGSVIIRKQEGVKPDQRKILDRYDILHTPDFNANSKEYILYREGLEKENLSVYLVSLCKYFYELQSKKEPADLNARTLQKDAGQDGGGKGQGKGHQVFQCQHCLTVYDEEYGDPASNEPPGRPFEELSPAWSCPVCGSEKEDFRAIEKSALIQG